MKIKEDPGRKPAELTGEELRQVTGGNDGDEKIGRRGKNGNPVSGLSDEASAGLIADPEHPGSGNVSPQQRRFADMRPKDEPNALSPLSGEELDAVTGGADNGADAQPDRHNIRSPLTGAGIVPPGGTEYDGGEKKAPDFYIELPNDISL